MERPFFAEKCCINKKRPVESTNIRQQKHRTNEEAVWGLVFAALKLHEGSKNKRVPN
jgi:hypothetical protein